MAFEVVILILRKPQFDLLLDFPQKVTENIFIKQTVKSLLIFSYVYG